MFDKEAYEKWVSVNNALTESKTLLNVKSNEEIPPAINRLKSDNVKLKDDYRKGLIQWFNLIKRNPLKASRKGVGKKSKHLKYKEYIGGKLWQH